MNTLSSVGLIFGFCGVFLHFVAGILYNPAIQRYLEKCGGTPSCFLFSASGLRDYLTAKKIAKRWGHQPEFLKNYERLQTIAASLFTLGLALVAIGEFLT